MLLINTFSPNMVKGNFACYFEELSKNDVYSYLRKNFTSAISSKEVAFLYGSLLQIPLGVSNISISMSSGDQAILGLYKGPKIKFKQFKLTPDAYIKWYLITID
jgi:hypothetical protein